MPFQFGLLGVIMTVIAIIFSSHGNFGIFLQIEEYLIIGGLMLSSFIMSNSKETQKDVLRDLKGIFSKTLGGDKKDYVDILLFSYKFFGYMNANSPNKVESEVENPEASQLFKSSVIMMKANEVREFFCDYIRIICLGIGDSYSTDEMMQERITSVHNSAMKPSKSILNLSESLPGIGLVAAVLGVVLALASVGDDPAVLAGKIASAMIGTLLGIFLSYCIAGPIGSYLKVQAEKKIVMLECMKVAIMFQANGHSPSLSVEFARQVIPTEYRPTFFELEQALRSSD